MASEGGEGGGGFAGVTRISNGGCDCPDMGFFRVWQVPIFPDAITNHVFDGLTFIPIDFGDYQRQIEDIAVLLDGNETPFADYTDLQYQGVQYWGVDFYADRIGNGTHQIQLRCTLRVADDREEEVAEVITLSNSVQNITIENEIVFTNWSDLVWTTTNFTFTAQLLSEESDWSLVVYDAWQNALIQTNGHTSNGAVDWTWNLQDTQNGSHDTLEADPYFDPWITFQSSAFGASITRPMPIATHSYPAVGRWIFTYLDTFYAPGTQGGTIYSNAMSLLAGGPGLRGIPALYIPLRFGTNFCTQEDRDESWATLRRRMSEPVSRNLYYYGHGWGTGIGGDRHTYNSNGLVVGGMNNLQSKALLTSKQVRDQITFNKYSGSRPYRFVWLDGCSTANGDWPGAFGISKATNSLSFYTNRSSNPSRARPSAFVGWNQTVGGDGWGNLQNFMNCRTEWMFRWQQNWNTMTLVEALEEARFRSDWISQEKFWGAIRVFGYGELRMNEYNQQKDWPN